MELIERFLKYVSFDTQSSEEGEGCPSTDKQMVFARYLENELKAIGLEEVSLTNMDICTPRCLQTRNAKCLQSAL